MNQNQYSKSKLNWSVRSIRRSFPSRYRTLYSCSNLRSSRIGKISWFSKTGLFDGPASMLEGLMLLFCLFSWWELEIWHIDLLVWWLLRLRHNSFAGPFPSCLSWWYRHIPVWFDRMKCHSAWDISRLSLWTGPSWWKTFLGHNRRRKWCTLIYSDIGSSWVTKIHVLRVYFLGFHHLSYCKDIWEGCLGGWNRFMGTISVSYTHLTLPTICSV